MPPHDSVSPSSPLGVARSCSQGWRKDVGGLQLPPPGRQSGLPGPFKSSRPSSGRGRDYPACPGWTQVEPKADERNAPPRAQPGRLCLLPAPAPSPAGARPQLLSPTEHHGTLSPTASRVAARLSPSPVLSVPVCSGGAPTEHGVRGQRRLRDFPRGAQPPLHPGAPLSLCPANSRWQGEQICLPPERS